MKAGAFKPPTRREVEPGGRVLPANTVSRSTKDATAAPAFERSATLAAYSTRRLDTQQQGSGRLAALENGRGHAATTSTEGDSAAMSRARALGLKRAPKPSSSDDSDSSPAGRPGRVQEAPALSRSQTSAAPWTRSSSPPPPRFSSGPTRQTATSQAVVLPRTETIEHAGTSASDQRPEREAVDPPAASSLFGSLWGKASQILGVAAADAEKSEGAGPAPKAAEVARSGSLAKHTALGVPEAKIVPFNLDTDGADAEVVSEPFNSLRRHASAPSSTTPTVMLVAATLMHHRTSSEPRHLPLLSQVASVTPPGPRRPLPPGLDPVTYHRPPPTHPRDHPHDILRLQKRRAQNVGASDGRAVAFDWLEPVDMSALDPFLFHRMPGRAATRLPKGVAMQNGMPGMQRPSPAHAASVPRLAQQSLMPPRAYPMPTFPQQPFTAGAVHIVPLPPPPQPWASLPAQEPQHLLAQDPRIYYASVQGPPQPPFAPPAQYAATVPQSSQASQVPPQHLQHPTPTTPLAPPTFSPATAPTLAPAPPAAPQFRLPPQPPSTPRPPSLAPFTAASDSEIQAPVMKHASPAPAHWAVAESVAQPSEAAPSPPPPSTPEAFAPPAANESSPEPSTVSAPAAAAVEAAALVVVTSMVPEQDNNSTSRVQDDAESSAVIEDIMALSVAQEEQQRAEPFDVPDEAPEVNQSTVAAGADAPLETDTDDAPSSGTPEPPIVILPPPDLGWSLPDLGFDAHDFTLNDADGDTHTSSPPESFLSALGLGDAAEDAGGGEKLRQLEKETDEAGELPLPVFTRVEGDSDDDDEGSSLEEEETFAAEAGAAMEPRREMEESEPTGLTGAVPEDVEGDSLDSAFDDVASFVTNFQESQVPPPLDSNHSSRMQRWIQKQRVVMAPVSSTPLAASVPDNIGLFRPRTAPPAAVANAAPSTVSVAVSVPLVTSQPSPPTRLRASPPRRIMMPPVEVTAEEDGASPSPAQAEFDTSAFEARPVLERPRAVDAAQPSLVFGGSVAGEAAQQEAARAKQARRASAETRASGSSVEAKPAPTLSAIETAVEAQPRSNERRASETKEPVAPESPKLLDIDGIFANW